MVRYFLRSTIRNAKKNGVLSFAKLFGIAISFAVVLFAAGYVYYETSFDKFIPDHDRIFRCLMTGKLNNNDADFAVTSPEMAQTVVNDIPEVSEALRIITQGEASFIYDGKTLEGGELLLADSNFFSFFSLPIEKELQNPFESENNLMVSKSLALKHFGSVQNAINKAVKLRGDDCVITGIFDDFPKNFHLQFDLIQSIEKSNPERVGWGSQSYYTYIKTNTNNIDPDLLSFKLSKTVLPHMDDAIDGVNAKTWDDLIQNHETYIIFPAEPLKDIHFGNHRFDPAVTANKTYVYGAIILAILVLLISSINYVNLSIADLSTRFREIGIHKTSGAFKTQIAYRFIFESCVYWSVGFLFAVVLYQLAGKPLAQYLELEFNISTGLFIKIGIISFVILVLFNLVTNILPISHISGKKILNLIKDDNSGGKIISVRSAFIFLQFILSALIILGSLIVQKQINFMVTKDRGYDTENVIMLSLWSMDVEKRKAFIEELKDYPVIRNISTADNYFGQDPSMNDAYYETYEPDNYFHVSRLEVDAEFLNTFDIKLLEGRFFEKERQSDYQAVVINEAAQKEYPKEGSLLGKKIVMNGRSLDVIGITKDFNYRSLHHKILPLIFVLNPDNGNVFIKTSNSQIPAALNIIEKQWKKFGISYPFDYSFHDEILARHYLKDQQAKKLLLFLSIISITIACIGLYAISFFIIVRKTKEIGVRKVNGARIVEVMSMLSVDFLKWIAVAFIIATPIAYITLQKWLENFAYKTNLSWWIFALAGLIALGTALLTISWQSWRAATRNPVEALRYE